LCCIYGATTPVGLPDACLKDLLLGLSHSCSNTNCHVNRLDNCAKRQVTEFSSLDRLCILCNAVKRCTFIETQCITIIPRNGGHPEWRVPLFYSKSVGMVTSGHVTKIAVKPFDPPSPKTPCYTQTARITCSTSVTCCRRGLFGSFGRSGSLPDSNVIISYYRNFGSVR